MAQESKTAVYAAMAGNLGIAVMKFVGAGLTGSSSMLSEAIHSLVDTADQLLLLIGLNRSSLPPDHDHPFGHGKEMFFWSLIVAVLIFGVGGGISVYEGIVHIQRPSPLESPFWNYVILAVSMIFEGSSLIVALRAFGSSEKVSSVPGVALVRALWASKNPAVFTVVAEDSAALAGLLLALGGVWSSHYFERPELDGVASILIGVLLAAVASFLIFKCRDLLVGQGVDAETARCITDIGQSVRSVESVARPVTMYFGPKEILLTLDVRFTAQATAADIVWAIEEMEAKIKKRLPDIRQIYIEAHAVGRGSGQPFGRPAT